MIGILNYGVGNINAFQRIFDKLNILNMFISKKEDFKKINGIILPGVGTFDTVMECLNKSGLKDYLSRAVLIDNVPVFGVCVGLQIMSKSSEEGNIDGLGWIDSKVKKFNDSKVRVPHMGWNNIEFLKKPKLFNNIDLEFGFYFVHSYYLQNNDKLDIEGSTFYENNFTSFIKKNNIYGSQFHPEKSHSNGVNLLKNFSKICLDQE
tara:strand:+ start:20064 stop:20681 length:618 start_codon:yes stop_codon:yes gene_type:complete